MAITTAQIKELREATGAGILEAKKVLEKTNGNFEEAIAILREKGAVRAADRAERAASEGIIEQYTHPGNRIGVMVELNCETDFVGRNEAFRELAHDLALHIAAMSPRFVSSDEVPQDQIAKKVEEITAVAKADGKPDNIIEKIVDGTLSKFYEETCLLNQPFIKDDSVKVGEMVTDVIRKTGENIIIRRFIRYELGEPLG